MRTRLQSESFEETAFVVDRGLEMLAQLEQQQFNCAGSTVLEIGPGWEPNIPILCYLKGCSKIILVDLYRIMNKERIQKTLSYLKENSRKITKGLGISLNDFEQKINISGNSIDGIFKQCNIEYRAPYDARRTELSDKSVDVIYSHAVLEHIPGEIIMGILSESHRILKQGGLLYHAIDNSDHFAHYDPSISPVNFLKYGERFWGMTAINPQCYHNRFRRKEYAEMIQKCGFNILSENSYIDQRSLEALKGMTICPQYRDWPVQELARLGLRFLARKSELDNCS